MSDEGVPSWKIPRIHEGVTNQSKSIIEKLIDISILLDVIQY